MQAAVVGYGMCMHIGKYLTYWLLLYLNDWRYSALLLSFSFQKKIIFISTCSQSLLIFQVFLAYFSDGYLTYSLTHTTFIRKNPDVVNESDRKIATVDRYRSIFFVIFALPCVCMSVCVCLSVIIECLCIFFMNCSFVTLKNHRALLTCFHLIYAPVTCFRCLCWCRYMRCRCVAFKFHQNKKKL